MEEVKKSNKKKIFAIVAIIVAIVVGLSIFLICNNGSKTEEKEQGTETKKEQITPLMYEITKEGSDNKIYLFGSIHLATEDFDYPKYVLDAYENSDYLAVEADIVKAQSDPSYVQSELEKMMYNNGTTVKDHLSKETYDKLVTLLKNKNAYNEGLEVYKVIFFETLLTQLIYSDAGIDANNGVDAHFINKANKDGKTILEVESVEYQSSLVNSFSDRLYALSLVSMLDDYDNQVQGAKDLYSAWKKGDPSEIVAIVEDQTGDESKYSEEEKALLEDYYKKLLPDRNVGMKNKLEQYYNDNKKVLVIVGTAHLVGDEGIANLLIKDGYTVTQINK